MIPQSSREQKLYHVKTNKDTIWQLVLFINGEICAEKNPKNKYSVDLSLYYVCKCICTNNSGHQMTYIFESSAVTSQSERPSSPTPSSLLTQPLQAGTWSWSVPDSFYSQSSSFSPVSPWNHADSCCLSDGCVGCSCRQEKRMVFLPDGPQHKRITVYLGGPVETLLQPPGMWEQRVFLHSVQVIATEMHVLCECSSYTHFALCALTLPLDTGCCRLH